MVGERAMNRTGMLISVFGLGFGLVLSAQSAENPKSSADTKKSTAEKSSTKEKPSAKSEASQPVALIETSVGRIEVKLFKDRAPKTVENFIGLATGTKEWVNPRSKKAEKGKSLYEGTIFHRVIPGFMIQGGDPEGTGRGGPGYKFEDEFHEKDRFDRPGILAMANAGPGTNGSQFFITVRATPHLNGRHTIFGEVIDGMDVVNKIISAPRDEMDRPNTPVNIKKITLRQ